MSKPLKIYIEYTILPTYTREYENVMEKVLGFLTVFEANQINWYYHERQTYIESFSLPTTSHYFALRKLRGMKGHSIFGVLDQFIEGGVKNIQIHAVKVQ